MINRWKFHDGQANFMVVKLFMIARPTLINPNVNYHSAKD